jgi:four helix bundle protein
MSQDALNNFGAYWKARELFDLVVQDVEKLRRDPCCYRLVGQQVGSADSLCANIEECYGRLSRAQYLRFLDIARGSARETRGRYERLKHWLDNTTIQQRVQLPDEIIGILTSSIQTLRRELQTAPSKTTYLREEAPAYGSDGPSVPPLDPRPSTLDTSPDPRPSTLDPSPDTPASPFPPCSEP